jgi:hypothetical protein
MVVAVAGMCMVVMCIVRNSPVNAGGAADTVVCEDIVAVFADTHMLLVERPLVAIDNRQLVVGGDIGAVATVDSEPVGIVGRMVAVGVGDRMIVALPRHSGHYQDQSLHGPPPCNI